MLCRVDVLLKAASEDNVVSVVEEELKQSKTQFLTDRGATIADLVLYSAVASKLIHGQQKTAPNSVKNWFKNVEISFGFHNAVN
jgi:hypothetical protein